MLAFVDGERERFFRVDVLAGFGRADVDQAVPVVGRAVDDGIDVISV
jgi:hypothetical protein